MQYLDTLLPKFIDVIGEVGCNLVTYNIDSVINDDDEKEDKKIVRYTLSKNTEGSVQIPISGLKNVRYRKKVNDAFGEWISVKDGNIEVPLDVYGSKQVIKLIPDKDGNLVFNNDNRFIIEDPADRIFIRVSENFRKYAPLTYSGPSENSKLMTTVFSSMDELPDVFIYPDEKTRPLEEGDSAQITNESSMSICVWDEKSSSWKRNGVAIGIRYYVFDEMHGKYTTGWTPFLWDAEIIKDNIELESDLYYELTGLKEMLYDRVQVAETIHLASVLSLTTDQESGNLVPKEFDTLEIETSKDIFYGEMEIEGELVEENNLNLGITESKFLNKMEIDDDIMPETLKDLCKNNKGIKSFSEINASMVKDASGAFSNCPNLIEFGTLKGLTVDLDISDNSGITKDNVIRILEGLGEISTPQTIKLGLEMYDDLSDKEKSIATNKGWTILNDLLVDKEGLIQIGWTREDIHDYNRVVKKYNLWSEDEVKQHLVSARDKKLYGVANLSSGNTDLLIIDNYSPNFGTNPGDSIAGNYNYNHPGGPRPVSRFSESIVALPKIDTSSMESFQYAFVLCSNLHYLPKLDTKSCKNFELAFHYCESLLEVPLFDTSSVVNMHNMFCGCSNLKVVPKFDTSNVTNMMGMFEYCTNLTEIPQLNTNRVTNMQSMFTNCSNLTTVPLLYAGTGGNMDYMFSFCTNLTNLGGFKDLVSSLDLSDCPKLTHESLMNVINNLHYAAGRHLTLTLGAINLAKLTDEEKNIVISQDWILQ